MKINISKKELYRYYIEENKSSGEISKIFNCGRSTILRHLKKSNILVRQFTNYERKFKKVIDKDLLKKLYIEEGKSSIDISKLLNITIHQIFKHLKYYGFSGNIRHSGSKGNEVRIKKEDLYSLYVEQLKTQKEISKIYRCSKTTIKNYLYKYELKIKGEYRPKFCIRGNNHPTKRPEVQQKMRENHYDCSGRNNSRFGKLATHGKRFWYRNVCLRSGWEYAFVLWLDKNDIKWQYEPKTFDLGTCTYTPDFYLPEFNLYIEIKGWWRDKAKEKFELFKQMYCGERIKIIEEYELKKEGVL